MKTIIELIEIALEEDVRDGDHSSLSCVPSTAIEKAQLLVKDHGILAGMEIAQMVFEKVDPKFNFVPLLKDGTEIKPGDIAFEVIGPAQSILKAERLALNYMQRMSGIATKTRSMLNLLSGLDTKILDLSLIHI